MDFNRRVKQIRASFDEEYETEDIAANDKFMLDELATAMAQLEMLNAELQEALTETPMDTHKISDLNRIISGIRSDISKIQDDLKITRKTRKEKTDSIPDYIQDLKRRAAKFMHERMLQIYCPRCHSLIATIWLLDFKSANKFAFTCPQCKYEFIEESQLLEHHTNDKERIVPYLSHGKV